MQIDWTLISCLVIGFFAWAGLARGWWKEAITTIFLVALIFLLQRPDWSQWLIDRLNDLIEVIWNILPDSIAAFISNSLETLFGIDTGGGPIQLNASSPGTWVVILILIVAVATLIGRLSFTNRPTVVGSILGVLLGGLNGFLVLNLVREYLDGRALPGGAPATAQLTLAGGSSFGSPTQVVTIQATNLPDFSLLDSVVPWVLIGLGVVLAAAVIKTRFIVETNKEGGKRINFKKPPPFYTMPTRPRKSRTIDEIIDDVTKR